MGASGAAGGADAALLSSGGSGQDSYAEKLHTAIKESVKLQEWLSMDNIMPVLDSVRPLHTDFLRPADRVHSKTTYHDDGFTIDGTVNDRSGKLLETEQTTVNVNSSDFTFTEDVKGPGGHSMYSVTGTIQTNENMVPSSFDADTKDASGHLLFHTHGFYVSGTFHDSWDSVSYVQKQAMQKASVSVNNWSGLTNSAIFTDASGASIGETSGSQTNDETTGTSSYDVNLR